MTQTQQLEQRVPRLGDTAGYWITEGVWKLQVPSFDVLEPKKKQYLQTTRLNQLSHRSLSRSIELPSVTHLGCAISPNSATMALHDGGFSEQS